MDLLVVSIIQLVWLAILECSWPPAMRIFALWQRTWGSSLPSREVRRIRLQVFLAVGAVAVLVGAMMFQTGYLEQQSGRGAFARECFLLIMPYHAQKWRMVLNILEHCQQACGRPLWQCVCLKAWCYPRYFAPLSSRVRGLFVKHRTGNPLVDSVAEHQATSPRAYWHLRWTAGSYKGSWVTACIFLFAMGNYKDGVRLIGLWYRSWSRWWVMNQTIVGEGDNDNDIGDW